MTNISHITGCVSISAFASLIGTLGGIASSAVGINTFGITLGIHCYKSII